MLPGYSTESELANKIRKSVRTLRLWRQKRIGPPWTQCGDTILYRDESFETWLKAQERQPVGSQRPQPRRKPIEPHAAT